MISASKYIQTGEIAIANKNELLVSSPLGSCIAFIAYDSTTKTGGMAHIMLPGKSTQLNSDNSNKYATDAIDNLLTLLHQQGAQAENVEICLAGGANVLKKENDTIANDMVRSVLEITRAKNLKILASSLGGFERRTATLDTHKGLALFTIGDSFKKVLWEFGSGINEASIYQERKDHENK